MSVYGNCGNEALADLTNSSLIQNSAHRQFDIISRSRTLAVTSHRHHPASCISRLQSALILSDFYKYVISTNIFSAGWLAAATGGGGGWDPVPTKQCSTVSLACFLLYLTHSNTSYISHLIYNREQSESSLNSQPRSFCNFTSSGMESQWIINNACLDKIDEFVCPVFQDLWSSQCLGSSFLFSTRASGSRTPRPQRLTKPPSPTFLPYANFLLVQKRWNNEIFYGEFQCEIMKTNSTIFARDSCLNIISWSGQFT